MHFSYQDEANEEDIVRVMSQLLSIRPELEGSLLPGNSFRLWNSVETNPKRIREYSSGLIRSTAISIGTGSASIINKSHTPENQHSHWKNDSCKKNDFLFKKAYFQEPYFSEVGYGPIAESIDILGGHSLQHLGIFWYEMPSSLVGSNQGWQLSVPRKWSIEGCKENPPGPALSPTQS